MNTPQTDSALDVAGWFCQKAKSQGLYLEHERLQHLLFLSQVHYAISNSEAMLMPSIFICGRDGFFEPAIAKMATMGCPDFPEPRFEKKINLFLEAIWKKYASLSLRDLGDLVKTKTSHEEYYVSGKKNAVTLQQMTKGFRVAKHVSEDRPVMAKEGKKILISQNGPVIVSKWTPRKL